MIVISHPSISLRRKHLSSVCSMCICVLRTDLSLARRETRAPVGSQNAEESGLWSRSSLSKNRWRGQRLLSTEL